MDSIISPETPEQTLKQVCIVGTAPTWRLTPWDDQAMEIASLNDAYVLPGFRRASVWFDLHPISEMIFRPKGEQMVRPEHAPVGGYLRPEGHLEWLKTRAFPVYLHDCVECDCAQRLQDWNDGKLPHIDVKPHDPYPFPNWPNARRFPFKAVEAQYGTYFSSTPAWMLAFFLMNGYMKIPIFGIHLATAWEYQHQRPNMEFLIGMALARGVQFVIPDRSSLLRGKHKYAVEPKPGLEIERVERRAHFIKQQGARLQQRLAKLSWYQRGEAADIQARLNVLDIELMDARQEIGRLQALARVA